MRDVTQQLTDYFDATVERITAEDVLAGSEVRSPVRRPEPARLRRFVPAWAFAAGFVATVVAIGGLVVSLRNTETGDVGSPVAPPLSGGEGGAAPWPLVIAAGALLLAVVLMAVGRRIRFVGMNGGVMKTLERPEVVVDTPPPRRWPAIVIALLLLVAAGAAGWWLGSRGDSGVEIPDVVQQTADGWVDGDSVAVAALYAEDGIYESWNLDAPADAPQFRLTGRSGIKSHVAFGLAYSDWDEMAIDSVTVLDDLIAFEWTASGMSKDSLEGGQTMTPFETSGVSVYRMEDGLITRSITFWHRAEMFN